MDHMIRKIAAILAAFVIIFATYPILGNEGSVDAATNKIKTLSVKASGESGVLLKWSKTKGGKGYTVFRDGEVIAHLSKKTTSYVEEGLSVGQTYTFSIKLHTVKKVKYWFNKKTNNWQKKKPAKSIRGKTKIKTTYSYSGSSPEKTITISVSNITDAESTNADRIVAKARNYAWAAGTKAKRYSYSKGSSKKAFKSDLKKYMNLSSKKAQSDCGKFVSTCVRAAKVDNKFIALKGYSDPFPEVSNTMTIVYSGEAVPNGFLQPGDIIRYKKQNGRQHVLLYIGNGMIAESALKSQFPAIKKDTKKYNDAKKVKLDTLQVIRAN